ncbi:hypothetical protein CANCADRAFT_45773 [Tortispora caseinolytica NRRL Y-17796]|uniref:Tuberous sclerosis 1 n=1 Tax=Tortispora caseinolytica NRRL Y-17796 TaxID=767744 RepID=A0A1E4TC44_9ASCO|nr:hypothetical protein CANCADRAFT_45773 [Tortispora caseinolytica NRRL Y-17796]
MVRLRELAKAFNTELVEAKIEKTEVPPALELAISDYVTMHHSEPRQQEELKSVYYKIRDSSVKLTVFTQCLVLLAPAITSTKYAKEWFDLIILPSLYPSARIDSTLLKATRTFASTMMLQEYSDDPSSRTSVSEEYSRLLLDMLKDELQDPENSLDSLQVICKNILETLLPYANQRSLQFYTIVDSYFADESFRPAIIFMLNAIVSKHPPHLYHIHRSPLLEHILDFCLTDENSTQVIGGAAGVAMILPHIANVVAPMLPKLLAILARLICWDLLLPEEESEQHEDASIDGLESLNKSQTIPSNSWMKLFTVLYGMFPHNVLSFCTSPDGYFTKHTYTGPLNIGDISADVRLRSRVAIERHLLHPLFTQLTEGSELEPRRWEQYSDSEAIAAECFSLDTANSTTEISLQPVAPLNMRKPQTSLDRPDESLNEEDLRLKIVQLQEALLQYQRHSFILHNDLNFELYLKQLHRVQINQLKQKHHEDVLDHASFESIVTTAKVFKTRLARIEEEASRMRNQNSVYRSERYRYEQQLLSKNRELKAQKDKLESENDATKVELQSNRELIDQMKKTLIDQHEKLASMETDLTYAASLAKELEVVKLKNKELSMLLSIRQTPVRENLNEQIAALESEKLLLKAQVAEMEKDLTERKAREEHLYEHVLKTEQSLQNERTARISAIQKSADEVVRALQKRLDEAETSKVLLSKQKDVLEQKLHGLNVNEIELKSHEQRAQPIMIPQTNDKSSSNTSARTSSQGRLFRQYGTNAN